MRRSVTVDQVLRVALAHTCRLQLLRRGHIPGREHLHHAAVVLVPVALVPFPLAPLIAQGVAAPVIGKLVGIPLIAHRVPAPAVGELVGIPLIAQSIPAPSIRQLIGIALIRHGVSASRVGQLVSVPGVSNLVPPVLVVQIVHAERRLHLPVHLIALGVIGGSLLGVELRDDVAQLCQVIVVGLLPHVLGVGAAVAAGETRRLPHRVHHRLLALLLVVLLVLLVQGVRVQVEFKLRPILDVEHHLLGLPVPVVAGRDPVAGLVGLCRVVDLRASVLSHPVDLPLGILEAGSLVDPLGQAFILVDLPGVVPALLLIPLGIPIVYLLSHVSHLLSRLRRGLGLGLRPVHVPILHPFVSVGVVLAHFNRF